MALKKDTGTRQRQISAAAMELISENGMAGLNMADIASRVGVVPSAVYRHYRNKDEVIEAVFASIGSRLTDSIKAISSATDDPVEMLRLLMASQLNMIKENRSMPRIIFTEGMSVDDPDRKAILCAVVNNFLSTIADIVKLGQDRGVIRPDVEPFGVALVFIGLIKPPALLWRLSDGQFDLKGHMDMAWKMFSEMIVVNGASKRQV